MLSKVYGASSVFIFPSLVSLSYTYDPNVIVLVGFGTISLHCLYYASQLASYIEYI
jgi:hypothetical protein